MREKWGIGKSCAPLVETYIDSEQVTTYPNRLVAIYSRVTEFLPVLSVELGLRKRIWNF